MKCCSDDIKTMLEPNAIRIWTNAASLPTTVASAWDKPRWRRSKIGAAPHA